MAGGIVFIRRAGRFYPSSVSQPQSVAVFSPAKINLFLAITGRRADGFHDLVSVTVPLEFGDDLVAKSAGTEAAGAQFTLACDSPEVPLDDSNLILRAAKAYAAATGWSGHVHFRLTKRIPMGAGLGGGSSNAVAALLALEQLTGGRAGRAKLAELAAGLGSDCAMFLQAAPVVMRGRGELVSPLPVAAVTRLHRQRLLLFKPGYGVSTPWAYGRMVARGTDYMPVPEAESRLAAWVTQPKSAADLLFNNMEPAVFAKHVALPALLGRLRRNFSVAAGMSGSGSACFALLPAGQEAAPLIEAVREAWGAPAFVQETRCA